MVKKRSDLWGHAYGSARRLLHPDRGDKRGFRITEQSVWQFLLRLEGRVRLRGIPRQAVDCETSGCEICKVISKQARLGST